MYNLLQLLSHFRVLLHQIIVNLYSRWARQWQTYSVEDTSITGDRLLIIWIQAFKIMVLIICLIDIKVFFLWFFFTFILFFEVQLFQIQFRHLWRLQQTTLDPWTLSTVISTSLFHLLLLHLTKSMILLDGFDVNGWSLLGDVHFLLWLFSFRGLYFFKSFFLRLTLLFCLLPYTTDFAAQLRGVLARGRFSIWTRLGHPWLFGTFWVKHAAW